MDRISKSIFSLIKTIGEESGDAEGLVGITLSRRAHKTLTMDYLRIDNNKYNQLDDSENQYLFGVRIDVGTRERIKDDDFKIDMNIDEV